MKGKVKYDKKERYMHLINLNYSFVQIQVLCRMDGVSKQGHAFHLIDIFRVKEMCQHFNILSSWPTNLEALARNEFPKSRTCRLLFSCNLLLQGICVLVTSSKGTYSLVPSGCCCNVQLKCSAIV